MAKQATYLKMATRDLCEKIIDAISNEKHKSDKTSNNAFHMLEKIFKN